MHTLDPFLEAPVISNICRFVMICTEEKYKLVSFNFSVLLYYWHLIRAASSLLNKHL